MRINYFIKKNQEISKEFSAMPFEERKRIGRYLAGQQLLAIEQVKIHIRRNYKRLIAELTDWENNILSTIEREEHDNAASERFLQEWADGEG